MEQAELRVVRNGQNLPVLILQGIFDYLDEGELKRCRSICRHWNACIISYRYLPNLVDFYFDLKGLYSFPYNAKTILLRLISKSMEQKHASTRYVKWLQQFYLENSRSEILEIFPIVKITNLHLLPNFGHLISKDFNDILARTTVLQLEGLENKKFPIDLTSLTECFYQIRILSISTNLLASMAKVPSVDKCPPMHSFFEFLYGIVDLEIIIQPESYKRSDFKFIGIILASSYVKNVKCLSIKQNSERSCTNTKKIMINWKQEVLWILDRLLGQNRVKFYFCLTNLIFNFNGLSPIRFKNATLCHFLLGLRNAGLNHLSLKLEGEIIPIELASFVERMAEKGRCEVNLDLKVNCFDVSNTSYNNGVFFNSDLRKSIKKLTLYYTKDSEISINTLSSYRQFENLSCLCIEFKSCEDWAYIDFDEISFKCPKLTDLRLIQGSIKGYMSKWKMWKRKIIGISKGMIFHWHFWMIMVSLKRLQRLEIWSRMGDVGDNLFIWDVNDMTNITSPGCFGDNFPDLRKLSLRGVGHLVTDKALQGLYGLRNIIELEIIGNHKISSKGKRNLMQAVPSLQKVTIHI